MKDGVYLINCARGKVVDEAALLEALDSGKVAGAGIDVFEEEPTKNEALVNHPKVSVTPHIGAATKEAQERIGEEVVTTIYDFVANNLVIYNFTVIGGILMAIVKAFKAYRPVKELAIKDSGITLWCNE